MNVLPVIEDLGPMHLIGIGGAGMSALATVLLARGIAVSGSDIKDGPGLAALRARGALVTVGHSAEAVGPSVAAVVVSSAIRDSNPETQAAHARGIPVLHRAQVLALLMAERQGIAVAGTHGKTTTTSMVASILQRAGADPSFLIGGDLNEGGTNAHHGQGEWLVAEADESDGSFLWLSPTIAVITNIEAEHLDHYRDEEDVRSTFLAFASNVRPDGAVVAGIDDPGVRAILPAIGARVVTFGLGDADWSATRTPSGDGQRVVVRHEGDEVGVLTLRVPGEHNARNALAALAAADLAGIGFTDVAAALDSFSGVRRRFQVRGSEKGVTVVDEYAHHPTEVRAALSTAAESDAGRVIAVFQPHLYSRTAFFAEGFGDALAAADLAVITDVYGAREDPQPGVSGMLIVDAIVAARPRARVAYLPRRTDVAPFVAARARAGDLVLTIGAGDVTMLGDEILRALRERR